MIPIEIEAPEHTSPSGYAEFAVNLLIELFRRGLPVRYSPVWWDPTVCPLPDWKTQILHQMLGTQIDPKARIHLRLPDQIEPDPGRYVVNYTMFETDGIPNDWVNRLNSMTDEVWVPSDFNVHTFARSGVRKEKIFKVPLGIDLKEVDQAVGTKAKEEILRSFYHADAADRSPFIFMASMQAQPRKNLEGLLVPFFQAFAGRQDVVLVLKAYGHGDIPGMILKCRHAATEGPGAPLVNQYPAVLVNPQVLPIDQVHDLLAAADCYVTQSHGEGGDLMAMKAAAMGKPVIAPFWSGFTEYLEPGGMLSIPIHSWADAHNEGIVTDKYYKEQLWSQPDPEKYKEALVAVAEQGAVLVGDEVLSVQQRVRKNHSIQASADALQAHLQRALGNRVERRENYPRGIVALNDAGARPESDIRSVMVCPSPNLPCGIWEHSVPLSEAIPGSRMARTPHEMFQRIENEQVDLVHLQYHYGFMPTYRLELLYRKLYDYGVKGVVTTLHSYKEGLEENHIIRRFSDCVLTHTVFDPPILGGATYLPLPCHPPIVQPKKMKPRRRTLIGYFGFSFAHKGIKELVVAVEKLREMEGRGKTGLMLLAPIHPNPNPSTLYLDAWLRERPASKFTQLVHEYLKEEQVLSMLSNCDLIVLPYRSTPWIGSSAAARTAARVLVPMLTTATPFFDDFSPAHMFPEPLLDCPEMFAEEIQIALGRPSTTSVMREFLEINSFKNIGQRHYEIYREMLGTGWIKESEVANA